jgi:hypothetical protein
MTGHGNLFALTLLPLASTPRNPLPTTTALFSIPSSATPRPSSSSGTKSTMSLSGTPLTTMQSFMTVLTQGTASVGLMSEYVVEEREIMTETEGEWQGLAQ